VYDGLHRVSRDDRKKQGLLLDQFFTPMFADKLKAGVPIHPVAKEIVTMLVLDDVLVML
jgi:hypothetical protein